MAKAYHHIFKKAIEKTQPKTEKIENKIEGIFSDGWSAEKVSISYEPSMENRVLEITFKCPSWHPKLPVKIVEGTRTHEIKGDETVTIKCPVEKKGGILNLSIQEGLFQPSACDIGEDVRFLGCLFESAEIVSGNKRIKLALEEA